MSSWDDFRSFVDDGSSIKYFVDGVQYYIKPKFFKESFTFEFKEFYKTNRACFVGIGCYGTVRKISTKEYEKIKALYLSSVDNSASSKKKVQLSLF